jgi:hypothetical protein
MVAGTPARLLAGLKVPADPLFEERDEEVVL